MSAKLKLASIETVTEEPTEPTPREVLIAAHDRVKLAEETLGRVRDRKRAADDARWNAKRAAAAARKAVAAAEVVDPGAILEAMERGVDPTAKPTDELARAKAALENSDAAFAEADRHLAMWQGVVDEAEKSLKRAAMHYDFAGAAVRQPAQAAIEQRIRDDLADHGRLQAAYRAFTRNLRTDPRAESPL
jgi:hypothetical protein